MGRELLPGQPLPFQGAHRPSLTNSRTSFFLCNFAISDAYYDRAASLHPEQYLFRGEMLCVKHSYPAHSALMRQDSAGSTPRVGSVPPRSFPALARGRPLSSSLGFRGLRPFCTKLDYPLVTFICLTRRGLFSVSCFPSCSFFLLDPRTTIQCICTAAPQSQISRQCIQIIAEQQKFLLAGGLLGGEGKKWKGSDPHGVTPAGTHHLYFSNLIS